MHIDLLSFIEQNNLSQNIQAAMRLANSSTVNVVPGALRQIFQAIYWCPSTEVPTSVATTYFGVMGVGRNGDCWNGNAHGGTGSLELSHCGAVALDGVILPFDKNVKLGEITDGTSNTMAIGERIFQMRSYFSGAWIDGSLPDNLTKACVYSAKNMRWGITTPEETGWYVAGAAPEGAKKDILFNDLFWGSDHPGTVQFAFADGSVHAIASDTELDVLKNMATRNGQETENQLVLDDNSCFGVPPPQR